jgi:hypothetical protein
MKRLTFSATRTLVLLNRYREYAIQAVYAVGFWLLAA